MPLKENQAAAPLKAYFSHPSKLTKPTVKPALQLDLATRTLVYGHTPDEGHRENHLKYLLL